MKPEPKDLKPDYYLDNFNQLIDFVHHHYASILEATERLFYQEFQSLSADAQKLFVRLLMRSKSIFVLNKLKYDEILDIEDAASELVTLGWAEWFNKEEYADWVSLLTKAELVALFSEKAWSKLSRAELDEEVYQRWEQGLLPEALDKVAILEVHHQDVFDTYRLLFFGNLHQDLTDFVLQDIGLIRYESYPLSAASLPFKSYHQIEQHLLCFALLDAIHEVEEWVEEAVEVFVKELPPLIEGDSALKRRRDRIILALARELERLQAFERAVEVYSLTDAPPAFERRVRCLEKLGHYESALSICQTLLAHHNEEEIQFAEFFLPKLQKKLGESVTKKESYIPVEELMQLPQQESSVELDVVNALNREGDAYWVENSVFCGLFALVFWDVIFADIEGAFFNPFQAAPADFHLPEFISSRQDLVDSALERLQSEQVFESWCRDIFEHKQGVACRMMHWPLFEEQHFFERLLERVPLEHIRIILMRILRDRKSNRSGMPDLIFFPDAGGYELVEVKGPGDRLQKNQQRWMQYFEQHDVPHRVVRVEWADE
ncbi:VRR-NUC domain-containing protein [Pleionea sp. CnH1-48]|uniref:VRR-NUC domain-containing protein n=1 Tax=Pleionea sp. CnH1-48 TaxID=2954494 RepID=UPI002097DA81|nr:VRR-NUC domain-containing protein [Pleionea sp. CnH1-48]MCO7225805.1 VRR-NUC domain-containing protein [Pleionea sp. CnH1-48]